MTTARYRSPLVVVLLAAALLAMVALAREAYGAIHARRANAVRVLRAYSAFAATELTRRMRDELTQALISGPLFPALGVDAMRRPRPSPGILADALPPRRGADLRTAAGSRVYFAVELATRSVRLAADAPQPDSVTPWLADRVTDLSVRLAERGRYLGLIDGVPGDAPRVAAFLVRSDGDRRPVVAYGLVIPATALAAVMDSVLAAGPLLPPTGTGTPVSNDALAARLELSDGTVIGAGREPPDSLLAARDSLGPFFGNLAVRVAPRPEGADLLVIGGLAGGAMQPMLLLAAAVLLLGAAWWQLRRETDLARSRADFVANVSHELRTPLAQIRMFAETLQLGRVRSDEERDHSLRIVHDEARRMSDLVDNLLHVARGGRAPLEPVSVDVARVARDTAEAFGPLAAARGARLIVAADDAAWVHAEPDGMRQIILNLLDNTLKYGPAGQAVTLAVRRAGRVVRLSVDDEGPGVPVKARRRIFEAFTRLEQAGARGIAGTGIGLAVVRELAERFGGRAWVDDAPGRGARFTVELPQAPEPAT